MAETKKTTKTKKTVTGRRPLTAAEKAADKAEEAKTEKLLAAMPAMKAAAKKREKDKMKEILGEILTERLAEKKTTLYYVIRMSGLTQTTGRGIFAGESMPEVSTLLQLERGLGVPIGSTMAELDTRFWAWMAELNSAR